MVLTRGQKETGHTLSPSSSDATSMEESASQPEEYQETAALPTTEPTQGMATEVLPTTEPAHSRATEAFTTTAAATRTQEPRTHSLTHPFSGYLPPLNQLPNVTTLLPLFRGKLHEDPALFMKQSTGILRAHQIPDYTWLPLLKQQLQDEAASWWNEYGEFVSTWEQFQTRLQARFSNIHRTAEAHKEFYGSNHRANQPVEKFLRMKVQLHQRLSTNLTEVEVVTLLISQLSHDLRTLVRASQPTSIEELIMLANEFETDLNQRPKPKPSPTNTLEAAFNQLPKCRYCPARHFHRDCPVLKRQMGNESTGEKQAPPPQSGK